MLIYPSSGEISLPENNLIESIELKKRGFGRNYESIGKVIRNAEWIIPEMPIEEGKKKAIHIKHGEMTGAEIIA